jgi:hypothetical protein
VSIGRDAYNIAVRSQLRLSQRSERVQRHVRDERQRLELGVQEIGYNLASLELLRLKITSGQTALYLTAHVQWEMLMTGVGSNARHDQAVV